MAPNLRLRGAGLTAITAVLVALSFAPSVMAAGGLIVTHEREAWHDRLLVFDAGPPLPCTDPAVYYTPTVISTGHNFVTVLSDGTFHVDYLDQGVFVTVPTNGDPDLPTYSGRYTLLVHENLTPGSYTFSNSFPVRGTGTDGSDFVASLHYHLTVKADGTTTVEFSKNLCPHGDPLG
jgi:hypothetical protein